MNLLGDLHSLLCVFVSPSVNEHKGGIRLMGLLQEYNREHVSSTELCT